MLTHGPKDRDRARVRELYVARTVAAVRNCAEGVGLLVLLLRCSVGIAGFVGVCVCFVWCMCVLSLLTGAVCSGGCPSPQLRRRLLLRRVAVECTEMVVVCFASVIHVCK